MTDRNKLIDLIQRMQPFVAELNCLHLRANRMVSAERTRAILAEVDAIAESKP